jgi:hypothetical protein
MGNIIIDIPFIISVASNLALLMVIGTMAWYCTKLLKKIYFITDTMNVVNARTSEFVGHLEHVHSLDTYYGDQTIQELIKHSKELRDFISDYRLEVMPDDYQLPNVLEETEEEDEEKAG